MALFLLLIAAAIFIIPQGIAPNIIGPNYKNVTVWTHVNITHSRPEVLNVTIFETFNTSATSITVAAGATKRITCNATIRSWDGFNDIVYVNATLWHWSTSNHSAIDNNNSHYTNASCFINNTIANTSGFIGYYECNFDVYYYANNGTWACNVTALNSWNYNGSGYNTTTFYPVYALNVTNGIDYGNVAVYAYSNETVANVTNFGNMAINLSVEGYGTKRGDGLAMNCSTNGNISVANERFSLSSTGNNGAAWSVKTPLNSSQDLVANLTMPKQTIPGSQIINSTYWQLYIPPNPAGNCTGWIVFTAMAP